MNLIDIPMVQHMLSKTLAELPPEEFQRNMVKLMLFNNMADSNKIEDYNELFHRIKHHFNDISPEITWLELFMRCYIEAAT